MLMLDMKFKDFVEKRENINIWLPASAKQFIVDQAGDKKTTLTKYVTWLIEKERAASREG